MTKRGFTLIELLVVIAIIGLLSSIVLASLQSGRNKAKVSVIRQEMAQMHPELELTLDTADTYHPLICDFNDGPIAALHQAILDNDGNADFLSCTCADSAGNLLANPCRGGNTEPPATWAYSIQAPDGTDLCIDNNRGVEEGAEAADNGTCVAIP
jgi:prepilin-type N-terminal cleavage/methylation domain-containing protein